MSFSQRLACLFVSVTIHSYSLHPFAPKLGTEISTEIGKALGYFVF